MGYEGLMTTRRVRRKYPHRKIRVVLRTTEHRENKRATSLRKRNNFTFRANNREVSYNYLRRDVLIWRENRQCLRSKRSTNVRQIRFLANKRNVTFQAWWHRRFLFYLLWISLKIKRNVIIYYLMNTF